MVDAGSTAEEDAIIPIYIFINGNLVIVGEALIAKENGKYYGAFDFDTPMELGDRVEYSMSLVIGEGGQRTPVGMFEFTKQLGTEYTGSIEFSDDLSLDLLMESARYLVNV
jgi:hypothetical protein